MPGLVDLWGRRAHACPFCDAAAYAGRRLLVLAPDDAPSHAVALLTVWTDRLERADPADVAAVEERDGDVVARLVDAGELRADGVFVAAVPTPRLDVVAGLGLEHRGPFLAVDRFQRTSLPGLLAAGDCAWKDGAPAPGGQVVAALADGSTAAIGLIVEQAGVVVPDPPGRHVSAEATTAGSPASERLGHGPHDVDPDVTASSFWEARYAVERVWTGRPNRALVDAVAALPPGTALDLGCGEGGDAVWLAEHGWRVTAVDVAGTALRRGADAAAARGVGDRITWVEKDLADGVPDGSFDLVTAAYLLSPVALPRDEVLRAARDRVAPGGRLVVLSHVARPRTSSLPAHVRFPDLDEQLAALALDDGWTLERATPFHPRMLGVDGTVVHREDSVIVAVRRPRPTSAGPAAP